MIKREYKKINISEIKPYEKNNKKHGANVDEIVKSIQANTYIAPIIVDENNVILAGHGRKLALDKLGVSEADVLVVTGLSEIQKRDFRIRDNKLTELSERDFENIKVELEDLDILELNNLFDLSEDINDVIDEQKPEIEFSKELKETSQYIILYFDNDIDWMTAKEKFDIKTVKCKDSKKGYDRKGVNRVFDGGKILEKLKD